MTHHSHHKTPLNAFSIIELLVAVVVLSIVVVLMAQMLGSATTMISGSRKRMVTDEEARMVFDRMAADFSRMVKREDIHSIFLVSGGGDNDEMYFYTEAPAIYANTSTTSQSPVALVGYRVATNGLVRMSEGKNWDDLTFITANTAGTPNLASLISTNSLIPQPIGPSVFRMEYTFLLKPGTNSANVYTNVAGMGLKDISAIVVTLALLDETSRKIVDSTTLSNVAAGFQDATAGPVATNWSATLLGLSGPARSATRIYQRYIPVNP